MTRRCSVSKERMWRERLDRYRQSGVSGAPFCAGEGMSLATFFGWQHRLRKAVGPAGGPRVAAPAVCEPAVREAAGDLAALFVPVVVRPAVGEVRIEVSGGILIRLPLTVDERLLRACLPAVLQTIAAGEGNCRRDQIKILAWDREGLCLWYNRLEACTFQVPPAAGHGLELDATELSLLLSGIDLSSAQRRKRFRPQAA